MLAGPMPSRLPPRYAQLAQQLAADIAAGRFPVGSLLPTEAELKIQYGVSRFTVREALRHVQSIGLVTRHQGIGTRVVSDAPTSHYVHSFASVDDIRQFAHNVRFQRCRVSDVITATSAAERLRCKPGLRFLRATGVRVRTDAGAKPVCWLDVYVVGRFAALRDEIRSETGAIASLIERRYGAQIHEIRQEMSAVALPGDIAAALGVAAGSPAFEIWRWYLDAGGEPFEIAHSYYPGDRFTYSLRLRRKVDSAIP